MTGDGDTGHQSPIERLEEGVDHLKQGVRRRLRAAEVALTETAPGGVSSLVEGAEALVDPGREEDPERLTPRHRAD